MERAVILGNGRRLEVSAALGPVAPGSPPRAPTAAHAPVESEALDAAQVRHIEAALARAQGRIEGPFGAARLLEINPHTLRARMRKLGIDWRRFRPGRA
jgi:transcriptional regulator with GAF, ATPase, and Fis domain